MSRVYAGWALEFRLPVTAARVLIKINIKNQCMAMLKRYPRRYAAKQLWVPYLCGSIINELQFMIQHRYAYIPSMLLICRVGRLCNAPSEYLHCFANIILQIRRRFIRLQILWKCRIWNYYKIIHLTQRPRLRTGLRGRDVAGKYAVGTLFFRDF